MTRSRRAREPGLQPAALAPLRALDPDGQTGFRAFSPRALDVAEIVHDYNYAQVLTLDLLHKGMRLREVPISYRRRASGPLLRQREYLWRVPLGMVREMLRG